MDAKYMDIIEYSPPACVKQRKCIGLYIDGSQSWSKIRWIIGPWTATTTCIGNDWIKLMDVPWKRKSS